MIQIRLKDNVAAALKQKASAKGLGLEELLEEFAFEGRRQPENRLSADEVMALIESVSTDGNPNYKGTYSREDIYDDHD